MGSRMSWAGTPSLALPGLLNTDAAYSVHWVHKKLGSVGDLLRNIGLWVGLG